MSWQGQFLGQVPGPFLQRLTEVVDDQAHVDRLLPILDETIREAFW